MQEPIPKSQYFIQFIDLLLELYSHVPTEVCTEMRNLQHILIQGIQSNLDCYMQTLQ